MSKSQQDKKMTHCRYCKERVKISGERSFGFLVTGMNKWGQWECEACHLDCLIKEDEKTAPNP